MLKELSGIDDIIVNTDSDDAISISKKLNVNFLKRKDYFASSECKNLTFGKILLKPQKVNL